LIVLAELIFQLTKMARDEKMRAKQKELSRLKRSVTKRLGLGWGILELKLKGSSGSLLGDLGFLKNFIGSFCIYLKYSILI
jgi:hypothetical protein